MGCTCLSWILGPHSRPGEGEQVFMQRRCMGGAVLVCHQSALELWRVPDGMISSWLCWFCFTFHAQESWMWLEPIAEGPVSLGAPYKPWTLAVFLEKHTEGSSGLHCPSPVDICLFPVLSNRCVLLSLPPRTPLLSFRRPHLHFRWTPVFPKHKKQLCL